MAVFALTSATIQVGTAWTGTAPGGVAAASGTITSAVNISALVSQVELSLEAEELDFTNFASAGWRQKIGGLQMGTVALTLNQDFDASVTDAIFGLGGTLGFGSASSLFMDIRPTSAVRSATNPSYVLSASRRRPSRRICASWNRRSTTTPGGASCVRLVATPRRAACRQQRTPSALTGPCRTSRVAECRCGSATTRPVGSCR
jgi:hypothetical protein